MTRMLSGATAIFLASCHSSPPPPQAIGIAGRTAATMSLNGTTWEFIDRGAPTVITIDAAGHYIENRVSGQHVVHGIYRQIDGKDCFTSAMNDRKTSCWSAVPPTPIGQSASATSENGQTASFLRVPYRELKISN